MSNEKFSDKDMAGLSEEERAAITAEEETPAPVAAGDDDPTFGADVGAATADTTAVDAAATPATPATPAAAATPAADIDTTAAGERDTPFVPSYRINGPENFEATQTALNGERSALTAKFKEGEISVEELLDGQKVVDDKLFALREHQFAADLTTALDERGSEQRWKMEQDDFMDSHKQYVENRLLRSALNTAVKDIADKEENASRSGKWILNEAHKAVQASMGVITTPAQSLTTAEVAAAAAAKAAGRKPDLSLVPKTLANLPAADIQATGGDEFAHLDKLEGLELETALAKLTPDQESRYLRAAG